MMHANGFSNDFVEFFLK